MPAPAALLPAAAAVLLAAAPAGAGAPRALARAPRDDRGADPTGAWYGPHGPLALARAGDTLTFSYSAVFGATAHLCDGIGVAGLVGPSTWQYVDEQGTVTFTTRRDGVTMQVTEGIASFCGAGWSGDQFTRQGFSPAFPCTVTAPKAGFLTATRAPEPRLDGLAQGDRVEAVGLVNEGTAPWLLVRVAGREPSAAGLLERDALDCQEP